MKNRGEEKGQEEEKKTETVPFGDHRIPTKHYKEENSLFIRIHLLHIPNQCNVATKSYHSIRSALTRITLKLHHTMFCLKAASCSVSALTFC